MEIKRVRATDYKDDFEKLFLSHYSDDFRKDLVELDLNTEAYDMLHDMGGHVFLVAEDGNNKAGYISVIISNHHHTVDTKFACLDALYVDPEYRSKGVATKLIAAAEDELKDSGVAWINMVFRDDETASKVVSPLGYEKTEVIYTKKLKDAE